MYLNYFSWIRTDSLERKITLERMSDKHEPGGKRSPSPHSVFLTPVMQDSEQLRKRGKNEP
jgi:hypothetical protein